MYRSKKIQATTEAHNNSKLQNQTFGDVAKQWYAFMEVSSKKSTCVKYRNFLTNHIFPELEDIPLKEITTLSIEHFALGKIQRGRLDGSGGLSPKTVKDMLSVIREILKYAEKRQLYTTCRISDIRIKTTEKVTQIIHIEDQIKMERFLIENPVPKSLGILMSLYMGLRIGEICALRWENIRLDEEIISIRHTMQRVQNFSGEQQNKTSVIVTAPKSHSAERDIPIPHFLLTVLNTINPTSPHAFFLTGSETEILEPRSFQNYYRKVLEVNHIPYVNFHVLRHTFATRCIEEGFDMKSLSEILGHSTVNITLNRYVHASMDMKRKNMLKVAAPLSYRYTP